ncbi:MAG TPA: DUF6603 domain-containing protein [Polyangiaceae bacterium]
MADQRGTLDRLAEEVGSAFSAFEDLFAPDNLPRLFIELGLDPAVGVTPDAPFLQVLADAGTQAATLASAVDELVDAAESDDTGAILQASVKVIEAVVKLATDLDAVATDLARVGSGGPNAAAIGAFAAEFAERALEDALLRYLDERHPVVLEVLQLLAVAVITPIAIPPPPWDPKSEVLAVEPVLLKRELHLDRLGLLFKDALAFFETTYGWGTEAFDAKSLFTRFAALLTEIGPLTTVDDGLNDDGVPQDNEGATDPTQPLPPLLEIFALAFLPTTDAHPPGMQGQLYVDVTDSLDITLATFGDSWRIALQLSGAVGAGLGIRLLPPAKATVTAAAQVEGDVSLGLIGQAADPTKPFVIFGETDGSRLQAKSVNAGVLAGLAWNAAQNQAIADVGFEIKVVQGKCVIDTSKSDSFLQTILPSDGLTFDFDFDLGWSSDKGFFFTGSAGLETAFALNLTIGPFQLDTIHLALAVASDGLHVEASLDGSGTIGPISASVERIGVELDLAFSRGNLGPVDLSVAFKFPAGLGIDIEAGPITGGGFIEFDQPNGRYAGVLALSLYSIQVKAIGLLDTKLPNGESGYSFLVIISVEFTPIQLGFGFTLNGVGGLCGINRNFVTDAIQAGLRQHSLDHILFPKDPVKNAPAIISDLRAIFPPAEGRYVFGPMLEIGWGGGLNLVTAELGILLSLPSPVVIAILGQFNVNLPNPDAPIVELHLDVLGIIDFGKKLFSLDASLHDSRIVVFTIYGDMAMRLSWGDSPSFALAIGGLNPHFQPPPDFPTLKRLTIALSASDEFRLTIQTYFAITSNTFQLGAKAELYVGVSAFNVYGWLGFDALIVFKPFSFIVDFTAGLAFRSGTSTLLGISLDGELSGPTPWHATGDAHVTIIFFEISVHVDITWGESHTVDAPPTDAWPQLHDAIANVQNWSGSLPAGIPSVVTLAKPTADTASTVLVDPNGVLTMRERVCPLNQTLTKFGEAVPGPQTIFTLDAVSLGGQSVSFTTVRDEFAPAQFEEMSDQDKLSRPSFEDRDAGFAVGDGLVAFGQQFGLDPTFEDIYVDDKAPPPPAKPVLFTPTLVQQLAWALSNGAANSPLRAAALGKYAPAAGSAQLVTLAEETFVIASTTDLTQRPDITAPTTKGEAYLALAAHLSANPGDRDQLQVVPLHELAA